jgi:ABC-2 type transport system ATP-binding protein
MCARVAIMNDGEIIALDHTQALLEKLDEKRLSAILSKPLAAVPDDLKRFPVTLEAGGTKLTFRVDKNLPMNEVLGALAGHDVKEIVSQAPSLQEAFIKLTTRRKA